MRFRIGKRAALIALLAGTQIVCTLGGSVLFGRWLGERLYGTIADDVLATNRHMAEQVAYAIDLLGIDDLSYGSQPWRSVQRLIENTTLPNEGFVCVIERDSGNLLCHPQIRLKPDLRNMCPGKAALHLASGQTCIKDVTHRDRAGSAGAAQMPDGTHLIAVHDLPGLGIKILAHQREAGITRAVERITGTVWQLGAVVAVLLTVAIALLSTAIVRRYDNRLARINAGLEAQVERRGRELTRARDAVIFGLAKLAESRDDDTGQHLERIRTYVEILASELSKTYPEISSPVVSMIGLSSSLHDIGKVGIPDAILLKPGALTPEERCVIERHAEIGGACLQAIRERLGNDDFLDIACEIAMSHHEWWDGSGYPHGISDRDIPLAARIVAVADVYDALTTERVYKPAMSHDEAREILVAGL